MRLLVIGDIVGPPGLALVRKGLAGLRRARGRELRVIVNAVKASDADALRICRDIARAIEQQLDYPGEIKVTVIRETRALEVAKVRTVSAVRRTRM